MTLFVRRMSLFPTPRSKKEPFKGQVWIDWGIDKEDMFFGENIVEGLMTDNGGYVPTYLKGWNLLKEELLK